MISRKNNTDYNDTTTTGVMMDILNSENISAKTIIKRASLGSGVAGVISITATLLGTYLQVKLEKALKSKKEDPTNN